MLPTKNPPNGFFLELLGLLGFLGMGHIWAGKTLRGVLLMLGWWFTLLVMVVLPAVGVWATTVTNRITVSGNVIAGCFAFALVYFIVPLASGAWIKNELVAEQATVAAQHQQQAQPSFVAPPVPQGVVLGTHFYNYSVPPPPVSVNFGSAKVLLLFVGPLLFVIGAVLSSHYQHSDGSVDYAFPLWPLGLPLEFVGVSCAFAFALLATFKRR